MMIDIDELNDKFSIEGEVGFAELEEDMVFITISNKHAEADICLYGAQITNYKPYRTMDILWMSPDSNFEKGKAIRGGIPICFPWFGPHKSDSSKPQHGFARLMFWDVLETRTNSEGETLVRFQLCSSPETKSYWDHDFCAELKVVVGKQLSVTLKISNTSSIPFEYTCALHSYFNLSSIEEIAIKGLQNTRYHNQLEPGEFIQETEKLEIHKAETRHYYDTEATCVINDPYFGRGIQIAKSNSKVTTVWNPWEETCKEIEDMPDDAYQTFVCVETVNAFNDVIKLAPGEAYETTAVIGLEE
jgi:glucose-6-phosphate 1-epimerase